MIPQCTSYKRIIPRAASGSCHASVTTAKGARRSHDPGDARSRVHGRHSRHGHFRCVRALRDPRSPAPSESRVRGWLGETVRHAFPTLQAEVRGTETVLVGAVLDQAALHG